MCLINNCFTDGVKDRRWVLIGDRVLVFCWSLVRVGHACEVGDFAGECRFVEFFWVSSDTFLDRRVDKYFYVLANIG